MRAIIIGIFCVGMGTEAFARDCASILDRATASVNERELRSTEVNEQISEMCLKRIQGDISTDRVKFFRIGAGLDGFTSKISVSHNKLCEAQESSEHGIFSERIYSQNIHSGFFAAYDTCMDAESPLVYVLKNENAMRTAIVSISSRGGPIGYSISIDGPGASDVRCSRHGIGTDLQKINFSEDRLDRKGFKFTCNHSPKTETESTDNTRVYSPAVVSIATDFYERSNKIMTIPFSGSTYVVGKRLKTLESEINDLKQITKRLSTKDMSIDREIYSINSNNTINLSRPISVLSVDRRILETHFEFNVAEVDTILCREDWNDQVLSLVNNRNGLIDYVKLSRTSNEDGIWGSIILPKKWSDTSRDWRTGDTFSFLIPSNREQCQSSQ